MPDLDMYRMKEPVEWLDEIDKAKVRIYLHALSCLRFAPGCRVFRKSAAERGSLVSV